MDTNDESAPETENTEKVTEASEVDSQKPVVEHATVAPAASENKFKRLWHSYLAKKKITIPLTVLALIVLILAIPFSRYQVLGLFLKQQFSVKVVDSKTGDPVTGADIDLAGVKAVSDDQGKAVVKAKVGHDKLLVTKKYYADSSQTVLVPISKKTSDFEVKLTATGRLVPVKVINKISGQALEGASLKVSGTEGKTDKDGTVSIALPADKTSLDGVISAAGYNDAKVTVIVTEQKSDKNTFGITPAGKIYFLSKASGNIDVVKTNLDGTDRQTVLKGTGKEEDTNTILLASRDWKYLALKSRRDSKLPKLYLISTADDKVTTIDEGDANFTLVGWQNNFFVYEVYRNTVKDWQPKQASIKSYNAQTNTNKILDNTNASGTDDYDYKHETFSYSIFGLGNNVIYSKNWDSYASDLAGKQNTLNSINADGSGKKIVSSLDAEKSYFSSLSQSDPQKLLIEVGSKSSSSESFYSLDINGQYTKTTAVDDSSYLNYPTYLLSPSGNLVFWYEERDGKNSLFTSKPDKSSKDTIGSLTEFKTYGWFSDSYLLVSKKDSELYILANSEIKDNQPLKISDYHKPNYNFYGYGGGYGGPN